MAGGEHRNGTECSLGKLNEVDFFFLCRIIIIVVVKNKKIFKKYSTEQEMKSCPVASMVGMARVQKHND